MLKILSSEYIFFQSPITGNFFNFKRLYELSQVYREVFSEIAIVIGQSSLNFQLGTILDPILTPLIFKLNLLRLKEIYKERKKSKYYRKFFSCRSKTVAALVTAFAVCPRVLEYHYHR